MGTSFLIMSLIITSLFISGCSSNSIVSENKKDLVQVSVIDCNNRSSIDGGTNNDDDVSSASTDSAQTYDIPEEVEKLEQNYGYGSGFECLIDGVHTSVGWVEWGVEGNGGEAGEVARKWDKEGRKYIDNALPILEGRVLVVVKGKYGKPGDYLDIQYTDGHVLHAIMLDTQGSDDDVVKGPYTDWGHGVAQSTYNIIEWYSDCDSSKHLWRSGRNPCNIKGFEWVTGTIDKITNTGGVNTGVASTSDVSSSASDETCNDAEDNNDSVSANPGDAAKVDESTSARLQWLYGDAGVPTTESANEKYLTTFDVKVRNLDGKDDTLSLTMHKKIKDEVISLFKDIYNNTNYRFDVNGDTGSLRDWNSENGNFHGAQKNSNHAYGLAIDVNATHNNGTGSCDCGSGYSYNPGSDSLSIGKNSKVVKIFKKHGFFWGGDWTSPKDYMHFAYTNH